MSGMFGVVAAVGFFAISAALFHHYVVRIYTAGSWLSKGALLVDVDTVGEFALRHPAVAISMPLEVLAKRASDLGSRNRPMVVFAHRWSRGARAVNDLHRLGFRTVLNAAGMRFNERLSAAAERAAESRRPPLLERVGANAANDDVIARLQAPGLDDANPRTSEPTRPGSWPPSRNAVFARILVPIDYSAGARLALRTALDVQKVMGSEVHLFHLADVGADDRFIASMGGSTTTPAELVAESKARLVEFVENVCPDHSSEVSVHADAGVEIVAGIERVASEVGATVVLLAHRSTSSVFRTHVEQVTRRVEAAVLLL